MTSKQGYGTSSDHEQPFYHVLPSISSLQSYEPETCMCVDMTLTSYLITGKDPYLSHEQSLNQVLNLCSL